jgi:hypothetical protein
MMLHVLDKFTARHVTAIHRPYCRLFGKQFDNIFKASKTFLILLKPLHLLFGDTVLCYHRKKQVADTWMSTQLSASYLTQKFIIIGGFESMENEKEGRFRSI